MSDLRLAAEVARWEFRRYLKPKQQVIGAVLAFVLLLGGALLARRVGDEPSVVEIAVVGAERLDLPAELGQFRIERFDASAMDQLRREVEERARDAVLVVVSDGSGELITRQTPSWRADLSRELGAFATRRRLEASGIELDRLAAIQAPFQLAVQETARRGAGGERFVAFVALGITMLGLFTGMGYIFISVTGEKQGRLSEQIISAISPQAWIDGKIIGLAGVSLVSMFVLIVPWLVFVALSRMLWSWSIPVPTTIERFDLLLAALGLIFLGFMFWFAFITAVAALVDDPHTSTRGQLMLLPMLAVAPAFFAVSNPDAAWIRVLSILPPTSAGVLPARLLVANVPWWHAVLAAVLLLGAIALLRRAAAKVFRLGMLMYGKEPTWAEVRRWVRDTG